MNSIFDMDLTRTLPPVLKNDPEMVAIAEIIAKEFQSTAAQAAETIIYARIDELPESLLDILAYDLHVDWYDYDYPINVKRETIKSSIKIHRHMGTKYAVEKALGDVFPGTTIEEWFEYGGEPYMFKVNVNVTAAGVSADKHAAAVEKVRFYKNLRSHLDAINYQSIAEGRITTAGACSYGVSIMIYPEE